ncbi:MAG TPA: DUF6350 family protein, partial [Pilimelia sp.]|nr:DUF6350 family protein [Pilimelia sp.]
TRGVGARHSGSVTRALAVGGAVGGGYGILGAAAAVLLGDGGPGASPPRAAATLAAFGAAAALLGALRATGAVEAVARRTPDVLRDGLRTGVVVALLLLGAGAGAAGIALAVAGGEAGEVYAAYRTGVAGQAGMTLICLAYAPNAATWAAAYLVGPGFAVGAGTVVRVTDVTVGGLPAVPLFAALPAGPLGGMGAALVGVPVVAGLVGGWLLARRRLRQAAVTRSPLSWPRLLGAAALAGPVAGLTLGLVAELSGGPLGDGHLARLGPVGWHVGAVAAAVVAVGALAGAAAGRSFLGPPGSRGR